MASSMVPKNLLSQIIIIFSGNKEFSVLHVTVTKMAGKEMDDEEYETVEEEDNANQVVRGPSVAASTRASRLEAKRTKTTVGTF
jgi:hypothetical protein